MWKRRAIGQLLSLDVPFLLMHSEAWLQGVGSGQEGLVSSLCAFERVEGLLNSQGQDSGKGAYVRVLYGMSGRKARVSEF